MPQWNISCQNDYIYSDFSFSETFWRRSSTTPTLEQQAHHKILFMRIFLPPGVRVSVIGYSISCHLLVNLLRNKTLLIKKEESDVNNVQEEAVTVDYIYFVFPVIERMWDTIFCKISWFLLQYFSWLIFLLFYVMLIFPSFIKFPVIKFILACPQDQFVQGAVELIQPAMLRRVLDTLREEIESVKTLDIDTIRENKEKMLFYYGFKDVFTPQKYLKEMREALPGVKAFLGRSDLLHVYVTHCSSQMAQICYNMITTGHPECQKPPTIDV